MSDKAIFRKVDELGRIALPLEWRKKFVRESNLILLRIEGSKIVIEPVLFNNLEAFIDIFYVDVDPDAFGDYNKLKRALLGNNADRDLLEDFFKLRKP